EPDREPTGQAEDPIGQAVGHFDVTPRPGGFPSYGGYSAVPRVPNSHLWARTRAPLQLSSFRRSPTRAARSRAGGAVCSPIPGRRAISVARPCSTSRGFKYPSSCIGPQTRRSSLRRSFLLLFRLNHLWLRSRRPT